MTPETIHDRARMLAAGAVDVDPAPEDAAWLNGHLNSCSDCRAVADEYNSIHLELRSLPMPEPPRDLWARTSAALDAAGSPPGRRALGLGRGMQTGRRPLFTSTAAVGLVVLVAAASIISQTPLLNPAPASTATGPLAVVSLTAAPSSQTPGTPLGFVLGNPYWLASAGDLYQIKGGAMDCTQGSNACVMAGSGETLGSITSDSEVSAVIGPDASKAAVWTAGKVAILPLSATSKTVALDLLTPRPTAVPTGTPVLGASPSAATTTAASPTAPPVEPTTAPGQPLAILSGYEVVGRDPEFSADGTFVAFAARPIDHSTGPDVFIWKSGQEQARRLTGFHSDLFAGWFGSKLLISEIAPAAAGSSDKSGASSFLYDPATSSVLRIARPMLLPAIDPTGRYLVYWAGAVRFDPVAGLWQPGSGELYFDDWSNLALIPATFRSADPAAGPTDSAGASAAPNEPEPTPAITPAPPASPDGSPDASPTDAAQPTDTPAPVPTAAPGDLPALLPVASGPGSVFDWIVRWDRSGQYVAVWVANPGSDKIGRLKAFAVDAATGIVNVNEPRLNNEKVLATISFDGTSVVYTSAVTGKTFIQALPLVPPSNVSTPTPTEPGQVAGSPNPPAAASDKVAN